MLERCLAAVARQTRAPDEVRVVDNTSGDPRVRAIADRFGATYQVEPRPGLSRARNAGARAATADIVCYTDDDAVPEPTWIEHLVEEFADPRVAAVGGAVEALRVETDAEKTMAALEASAALKRERRRATKADPGWFAMANFGALADGGNLALRREVFDRWPGFDERLGRGAPLGGGEDHYVLFELIELGFTVAYTPRAVVRHPYPETLSDLRRDLRDQTTDAAAYMTFLFFEEPKHREALVRFVLERLRGVRRPWRVEGAPSPPRLLSRSSRVWCALAGPWRYALARARGLERSGRERR
jgi:cellulose synthase/poly-beta-1,6-N-acetylglucosamine synthase-like glycosyltransferase